MNRLAVIIPTLDEQANLTTLLHTLHGQRGITLEIIVADGGSQDGTKRTVTAHGSAILVEAVRGRGAQMNAGRAATNAPWLLFLHADSRLESVTQLADALDALQTHPASQPCGHFKLRFRASGPQYDFLEAKTSLNRPNTTNGDQGMMMAASWFDELGGFDERLPFLEDQRLAERSRDHGGTWVTLPGTLSTSARRFQTEGFAARYFTMAIIMGAWAGGADEFFERMPNIYPAAPNGELDVLPILDAVRQTLAQIGPRRTLDVWLRGAKFARRNIWQLFYAVDVALADQIPPEEHPLLDFFDERFGAHHEAVLDALLASSSLVMLTTVVPIWSRLSRRRDSTA